MKRCPKCNRTYTDQALNFCLEDGTPLVGDALPSPQGNETIRNTAPRITNPPPGGIYPPPPPPPNQAPPRMNQAPPYQAQWTPMGVAQPRKSNAVWWILGGLAVIVVLGVGMVVVLLAVASMSSRGNSNRIVTVSPPNRNVNVNRSNANSSRENTNSASNLPASFSDDFSTPKWGVGSSAFGDLSYVNDEYHMRSKDKVFIVMYGPTNDYNTENATVRVTARNVDGISPTSGYGLAIHGERSKDDKIEDYTFLIYSGEKSQYKVVLHKGGTETKLVDWTPSSAIRHGTSTNQLEVRVKGTELSFYINGQFATTITDTANFKRGRAGLYTSDVHEVAFDDLEITR